MVELDKTTVLLATFLVLLAPYPLTSLGTTGGPAVLWQLGLALLVVGGVVPPLTRYLFGEDGDDDGGEDDGASADGEEGGDVE